MKECKEHELNLVNEHWTSYNEIDVELVCSLCKAKFKGKVKIVD